MILVKEDHCAMCGTKFAGQYEYDFQVCSVCDPIPTIEEIEQSSFSTAQVAAMAKRIAELEAENKRLREALNYVSEINDDAACYVAEAMREAALSKEVGDE